MVTEQLRNSEQMVEMAGTGCRIWRRAQSQTRLGNPMIVQLEVRAAYMRFKKVASLILVIGDGSLFQINKRGLL